MTYWTQVYVQQNIIDRKVSCKEEVSAAYSLFTGPWHQSSQNIFNIWLISSIKDKRRHLPTNPTSVKYRALESSLVPDTAPDYITVENKLVTIDYFHWHLRPSGSDLNADIIDNTWSCSMHMNDIPSSQFSWKGFWISFVYEGLPPAILSPTAALLIKRSFVRTWNVC
jgi:hypothetical protein